MTIKDDVLQLLARHPEGLADAEIAKELGLVHQQANQRCRQLEDEGLIVRDSTGRPIVNRLVARHVSGSTRARNVLVADSDAVPMSAAGAADDDWEGLVQGRLIRHLSAEGWMILSAADTASRARGVDVVAQRDGVDLLVEVKGYPSTVYARGEKAGQPKPTHPSVQAKHWAADALLKSIRTQLDRPDAQVAMCFPEKPRYLALLGELASALQRLDIWVFLVDGDRGVRRFS